MKTIEAFIEEIEGSEALQEELKAIKDEGALAEFLKEHDVEGTVQEFAKAMQAKAEGEGEISDDDAEAVAGGSLWRSIVAFFSGR
jgi:predicted ribosomally synthesized peptide with nif11-like leader